MVTMSILSTLLPGLGGALMRLLPELIGLWNKKTDNSHELAMLERTHQLKLQEAAERKAEAHQAHTFAMDEVSIRGNIDMMVKGLEATSAALHDQMKPTGTWWVDALNMLVRPLTTYYFLGCYGIVKTAMIVVALRSVDPWVAIIQCWTDADVSILFAILGFWFVGRTFEKK